VDYETTVDYLYLSAELALGGRGRLSCSLAYVQAEAGFDSVHFPEPEEGVYKADYDYTEIHRYSDLSQTSWQADVAAEVGLGEHASLFSRLQYVDFQDDEPWVYGDQTGSLFTGSAGVRLSF